MTLRSPPTEQGHFANSFDPAVNLKGSSLIGTIFNFTNCIVGAGMIGLGGAVAVSGGLISVVTIAFFAVLTKISLDLVIELSVQTGHSSYEELGKAAFGRMGRFMVVSAKFCYSAGCLIAYIVVIKDNMGSAIRALIKHHSSVGVFPSTDALLSLGSLSGFFHWLVHSDFWLTWTVSTLVILPLCLLRDMTPLSNLSMLSVICSITIVGIVMSLYVTNPNHEIRHPGGSLYDNWLEVRWGYLESLGTFVFTFVSQHTVHLTFGSLKPELRTVSNWKKVSSVALFLAASVSLLVAVFVYISFWQEAESDIFSIYPSLHVTNMARLLLCITMLLTFPLPFFTCRELLILTFFPANLCALSEVISEQDDDSDEQGTNECGMSSLQEPLLGENRDVENNTSVVSLSSASDQAVGMSESLVDISSVLSAHAAYVINECLLPDNDRQLKLPYHVALTCKLWFVITGFAVAAPNLGDVLNLVGCASGTIIAFILPACLSFRLKGFSLTALLILLVGGIVGVFGTFFSVKRLYIDISKL
ncbi:hypothetical protein FisN_6Lh280 [Fistulifera solaris]|uniref:Amino acid transporter transmembrane domain-containing protein n=1 Tax=Fistulifera solaris TaxID=1519565 RepID=A0A1Z5J5U3_FISSO|nr:hypothetical protein FisN_6Lh280 [Fistulifera solaris]|eukprot:GAX09350.1 hypothetical protein FisN_6Lh280 [Fistulifera solaris]